MVNLSKIKLGDVFSEESHYVVTNITNGTVVFQHVESKQVVELAKTYVRDLLSSADQYDEVVKVTKEDKKDGTPGIRTIFDKIKSSEVFTVVFKKQDKPKTKKAFEAEREEQREKAVAMIEKAKKDKKSMAVAYKEALSFIQDNPIKDFTEGEDRTLRGYKIQFVSRDGRYDCIDMDLLNEESHIRPVNINTIKELIYNGTKYVVE